MLCSYLTWCPKRKGMPDESRDKIVSLCPYWDKSHVPVTQHFIHMISNPPNIPAKTPSPRKWGNLPHTGQREGMATGLPLGWPAPEPALLPLPHTMSSPTFLLVQKLLILENHRKLWDTKDLTYNQSRWNIKNKTKARSYKSIRITLSKVFLYEAYSDNVSWLTGFGNIFKIGSKITYKTQSHYFKVRIYSLTKNCIQFSLAQSLSCVWLFVAPWIKARQASLSITNSRSLLRLMPIELVMPSSHLILCRPLLLLPPVPPSIRVFSNESTLCMRWPKYWSFSFSVSPSNEHPVSFRVDWLVLLADSQESSPIPQFKSINFSVLSFLHSPTLTSIHDHWKNHSLDQMDLCWQSNVSAF